MQNYELYFIGFSKRLMTSRGVFGGAELRAEALDYGVSSLDAVDQWLGKICASSPSESGRLWWELIYGAGAYVGEVIRRQSCLPFRWVRYGQFQQDHPELAAELPRDPSTAGVLFRAQGGRVVPPMWVVREMLRGTLPPKTSDFVRYELERTRWDAGRLVR